MAGCRGCDGACNSNCIDSCGRCSGGSACVNCGSDCGGGCYGVCNQKCWTTCYGSCNTGCSGGCKNACSVGCNSNCSGGCTGTCNTSCTGGCKGGCKGCTSCSGCTGCSGCSGCEGTCTGSCYDGCYTGCKDRCTLACDTLCNTSCDKYGQGPNLRSLQLLYPTTGSDVDNDLMNAFITVINYEMLQRNRTGTTALGTSYVGEGEYVTAALFNELADKIGADDVVIGNMPTFASVKSLYDKLIKLTKEAIPVALQGKLYAHGK